MAELPTTVDVDSLFARRRRRAIDAGRLPARLPRPLSESWRRSARLGLDPGRLVPRYRGEVRDGTRLARTADVVLPVVAEELSGEPVSLILADASGHVLRRWCPDAALRRCLDRAQLDTGFSYREEWVGTNGIGTALESGEPTLVDGGTHWNDELVTFSCAAVPVRHPMSGTVLGVVDLTALVRDSNPLLLAFTRSVAHRLEGELLADVGRHELALLEAYLAACRRGGGAVLAVGPDGFMVSRAVQERYTEADRAVLLALVGDTVRDGRPGTAVVQLPGGAAVRVDARPVRSGEQVVGAVARVGRTAGADGAGPPRSRRPGTGTGAGTATGRRSLPTLAGTSAVWQDTCRRVLDQLDAGAWTLLEGEDGVGKVSLARAAHRARRPAAPFRVLDPPAPDGVEGWAAALAERLAGDGTVVLRHLERLPPDAVDRAAGLLDAARDTARHPAASGGALGRGPWVVGTLAAPGPAAPEAVAADLARLVPLFASTVPVPPLRHHLEDVGQLADALLERAAGAGTPVLSAAARRQLALLSWPGNVTQLAAVLQHVVRRRRAGEIGLADLPPECLGGSRRQLTPIEALQRDAIVAALRASDGNKPRAAAALGLSRATIYRKIREYGVTWSPPD